MVWPHFYLTMCIKRSLERFLNFCCCLFFGYFEERWFLLQTFLLAKLKTHNNNQLEKPKTREDMHEYHLLTQKLQTSHIMMQQDPLRKVGVTMWQTKKVRPDSASRRNLKMVLDSSNSQAQVHSPAKFSDLELTGGEHLPHLKLMVIIKELPKKRQGTYHHYNQWVHNHLERGRPQSC